MATRTTEYTRLAGRGRKNAVMGGLVTLWIGKDHLLQIDSNRYSEEYRRFYFADIQTIILRRTKRWEITNSVLGALLLITVALHLWGVIKNPSDSVSIWIFAGIFETAFAIPLIFSLIGGPTCICQIQTAVQRENLSSLGKIRNARKVIEQIREAVTVVQGEAPPDLAVPRPTDVRRSVAPVIPRLTAESSVEAEPPTNLKIISLLLGLVSILAGIMALLKEISVWDYTAQGVLTTAQLILVVVILVKRADKAAWTKVILLGIWIFGFGTAASLINQGDLVTSQWNPIAQTLLGWGTIGLFGFLSMVEGISLLLSRDQPTPLPPVVSIPPPIPRPAFKDLE